ncbi:tetraacyldisaccharide 4'-kinase [Psychromonas sp. 14N.309.X.WAT.B.A12]|uniref:tetraacyldisaccharide 4'-kinase n=1 Tax=Psychromonas sp. 14N.309.X.WAT.B.A12 TaxID=2998322 RepID=UPI0025B0E18A|nr:tetraacyldisaccharide 4'-kinase [Psychromonas sp. 14N.309.X.WAT.B.A12]MDN2662001.1 tetraacyldisaccharide 4'-kinase [Psychromonas sp. 14N.309.X.WAT.B.A12]
MPFWYQPTQWWAWLLWPFALLMQVISAFRRFCFQRGWLKSYKSPLPVVVVGNISVGGNGKTPFVISLCELLIKQGYKPGVISRGYGGKSTNYPLAVNTQTLGKEAGDEPVLIHKRLGIPVVVDPIRANAADYLAKHCDVDVIITDDGLQHYALQRDIEIVVVDGKRRYGNQHIMPMGPLRESLSRLRDVDFIINNGASHEGESTMLLVASPCKKVDGGEGVLSTQSVNACAAIGYPPRFFNTLVEQGFTVNKQVSFADHHAYTFSDFEQFPTDMPLLMTEKDAVKCTSFSQANWWYLPIDGQLPDTFIQPFLEKLTQIKESKC